TLQQAPSATCEHSRARLACVTPCAPLEPASHGVMGAATAPGQLRPDRRDRPRDNGADLSREGGGAPPRRGPCARGRPRKRRPPPRAGAGGDATACGADEKPKSPDPADGAPVRVLPPGEPPPAPPPPHHNIGRTQEAAEAPPRHYFVMEFLEGRTLQSVARLR